MVKAMKPHMPLMERVEHPRLDIRICRTEGSGPGNCSPMDLQELPILHPNHRKAVSAVRGVVVGVRLGSWHRVLVVYWKVESEKERRLFFVWHLGQRWLGWPVTFLSAHYGSVVA